MFLLVLAYPGSPGQKAVKRLCVCVQEIYGQLHSQNVINDSQTSGSNVAAASAKPRSNESLTSSGRKPTGPDTSSPLSRMLTSSSELLTSPNMSCSAEKQE